MNDKGNRERWVVALIGFVLGLGAPLGWLALRFVFTQRVLLLGWLRSEIGHYAPMYGYMMVGTVVVFTLFGYFLGRHTDLISRQSRAARDSAEHYSEMAMTDALTGLTNARYLHEHLAMEMESAIRHGTPLSCLMLDIDGFKGINDTHGHPFGDTVLLKVAEIMRQCVRKIDMVGRMGGEEFLVIMPHTTPQSAMEVAERIRLRIQRSSFPLGNSKIAVTVSVGIATYPAAGISDKPTLLKMVDDALYRAKRAGKNRSVAAAYEPPTPERRVS